MMVFRHICHQFSMVALSIVAALGAAHAQPLSQIVTSPATATRCANANALNELVWNKDSIRRQAALHELRLCGPGSWDLKMLMKGLPPKNTHVSFINLITSLFPYDSQGLESSMRYLISNVESSDPETSRQALLGLGYMIEFPFAEKVFDMSQDTLARGLESDIPDVRIAAITTLKKAINYNNPTTGLRLVPREKVIATLGRLTNDKVAEVRAESLMALSSPHFLGCNEGIEKEVLPLELRWAFAKSHFADPSSRVRIAALHVLCSIPRRQLSPVKQEELFSDIITHVESQDMDIVDEALGMIEAADLLRYIESGKASIDKIPLLLGALASRRGIPPVSASFSILLRQLRESDSLSTRINAYRLTNAIGLDSSNLIDRRLSSDQFVAGLGSPSISDQLDAIQGLYELYGSTIDLRDQAPEQSALRAVVKKMEPLLTSPEPAIRWASALFVGDRYPENILALDVISKIPGLGVERGFLYEPLDHTRAFAFLILKKSTSPTAQAILSKLSEGLGDQDNEHIFVRGGCIIPLMPIPFGKGLSIELRALRNPAIRRLASESLTRALFRSGEGAMNLKERTSLISDLKTLAVSGNLEERYNSVYILGVGLSGFGPQPESAYQTETNDIVKLLRSVSLSSLEHPQVRRVADSLLSVSGYGSSRNNDAVQLSQQIQKCPFSTDVRFLQTSAYDPYEDRCMYHGGSGCGAGITEVYSALRKLLKNGSR